MNKSQKIFDIVPPEKIEYLASSKKETQKDLIQEKHERKDVNKKPSFSKIFLVFALFSLVVFGLLANFVFVKGEIQIWPKTESPNFKEKITVDTTEELNDISAKVIAGKFFEEEKTASQEFSATGKLLKEGKAQGKIRVYNNYSTSPQSLIVNTRFMSADGKLFRSAERATVPGAIYEKGKLQPGFIDIKVTADSAGSDYNIEPTTFSIPGFVGTAKYTAFYGKSLEPMQGGFRGEISQVTRDDLEKAKEILAIRLLEESKTSLKNRIPADFIILDKALVFEVINSSQSKQAGDEAGTFSISLKAEIKTIAFKKSDLENFATGFILSQTPDGKRVYSESLKINWGVESMDLDGGKMVLNSDFSAKIYSDINENDIKEGVKGKSLEEVEMFLSDKSEITKVQIKVWPFWIKELPQDSEKIGIRLFLD